MAKKSVVYGPPTFKFESDFWAQGLKLVGGIDEAGRGPLAGPVVASAVVLNQDDYPVGLNDSKKLSDSKREYLFDEIMQCAQVSIGIVDHKQIDFINIRQATFLAMREAALGLEGVDALLVDGNALPPDLKVISKSIVSGDALSLSISAASIIAKVTRDRLMREYAKQYPEYGFEINMGYPTAAHKQAISTYGPCPIHRMTFGPLKTLI